MTGDLSFVDDYSNQPAGIEDSSMIVDNHRDTTAELRDFTACYLPLSGSRLRAPRRARRTRSRIFNQYQRNTCGQTPARNQHLVVRTLNYESSPEHPATRTPSNELSSEHPAARALSYDSSFENSPSSPPASNMASDRIFVLDYQRPRRRRPNSPEINGEPDRSPRERSARRTVTRLLNHARLNLTMDESALRCLNCGLLPWLPVTGICGHTRCSGCTRRHPKCPCGATHSPWVMNVNVIVQDVIHKLLCTEQDLRQWLWERRELSQQPLQEHLFMTTIPPPPEFANEAPENNRNAVEGWKMGGNAAQDEAGAPTAEAGNDDMEEEGAWALPEEEYRRREIEERMAVNRVPITPKARLQYGAYLMEECRYRDAVPHLARAAIDCEIARQARSVLYEALIALSRVHVLRDIEGNLRQAITAQAASNWLRGRDLECVFCYDTYCRPVTTPCGHTYCRPCLERSLDYRTSCALCMQSLDLFQFSRVGVNQFLTAALQTIGIERISLPLDPHVIPILACTVAFPGMPCPLFLFEPRYWYMIRRILESNSRSFGMVATEREGTHSQYGTILEIRDCVHLQNGCTIVSTVGVSRFRVIERNVWDGWCDVARVETITDIPVESDETVAHMRHLARVVAYKAAVWISTIGPELRAKIETAFGPVPWPDTRGCWWSQPDGPTWLWWLISILPLKLEIKVLILATDSLLKRIRAVLRTLDTTLAQPPHSVHEYESALADWWMQRHL